ncbi:MAG: squalene--hopene cyclase [Syntrophobacteraceae bacterium]|nr:squalene--hopene cyclase [Desulfobacteraceae bacterium]
MQKKPDVNFRVIQGGKCTGSGAGDAAREEPAGRDPASVLRESGGLLASLQKEDGHWVFELEADVTIPSEYVMLQRFLGREIDEENRKRLAAYLLEHQMEDGGWPLFSVDGNVNISASVKAYFALKLLGRGKHEPCMVKARQMILSLGGAARCNVFTRIALALFGQIPWHTAPAMPVEIMLLPRWFFFHLSKVSYWSRTVIVPLLILYAKEPVCRLRPEEGIAELFVAPKDTLYNLDHFRARAWRKNVFILLDRGLKRTIRFMPRWVHDHALRKAEAWSRRHMQGEGGIGAIFPAMSNAVMALRVLGCPESDPDYMRCLAAIDELLTHRVPAGSGTPFEPVQGGGDSASTAPELFPASRMMPARDDAVTLCQPCNSPVWDTCLSLTALTEAGVPKGCFSAEKAMGWLFDRQIDVPGDWAQSRPGLACGGWAFQYENTFYPDVDDTSKVLMSLFRAGALEREEHREKIARAVRWVIGMQNSDGGWGAFDLDNNYLYLNDIPFADHGALLDPSTSDLTGRCIEMLGMLGHGPDFPPIARGIAFLRREQEEFGGWFGRWGVNYIYGTWSVLSGLRQAGEDMGAPYVGKAVEWLEANQNADGGWGETCASYDDPSLAGKGYSTASQTAWALLALMAADGVESEAVRRGVRYLAGRHRPDGWDEPFFTGTGFPRVFYLRYHGYRLFFPVWALGVYARLKSGAPTVQQTVSRPYQMGEPWGTYTGFREVM